MTRLRTLSLAALLLAVPACGALRDAMTSHTDIAARAGSQELTVGELAQLLVDSRAPIRVDVARTLAHLWVNFQLLGTAAARGDSLHTVEDADAGMWSAIDQARLQLYFERFAESLPSPDSTQFEEAYNRGELLAAAHILLAKQPQALGAANDSIKAEAERIAQTVTAANFGRVARDRSDDPGSKERGGDYGVFPPGAMVPEFDAGILSVQPGGISGVVETEFGYHIIRRSTFAEIRDQFAEAYRTLLSQRAESLFLASAEEGANIEVRRGAPTVVKAIAEDVDTYRDDRTVLATSRRGNLTAARMAAWMASFPPQSQMRQQVMQAEDSLLPLLITSIMRNELLLQMADSAGVELDSAELAQARVAFQGTVWALMRELGLSPGQLADSASTVEEREALAARRVAALMQSFFTDARQFIQVPEEMATVLRDKYESRVVTASLDRAVAEAQRLKTAADSAAAAAQPPSAVPMPAPDSTPQP